MRDITNKFLILDFWDRHPKLFYFTVGLFNLVWLTIIVLGIIALFSWII